MEKHKLLSLVRKTGKSFINKNPTGVYRDILNDNNFESLSFILKAKDLVMFSLLVPRFNMGSDIDEDYDRIENNMFTIELVEIYNSEPEVECDECGAQGKIIIKGCSDIACPEFAMTELIKKLQPVAQSIMYGEPCSTVPIFKQKR